MPFLSDTASAIKSRFGFHDHPADHPADPARTPNVFKSASRENLAQASAFRSVRECFDEDEDSGDAASSSQSFEFSEDPAFWKEHNVQVIIRIRPLSSAEISVQGYGKCVRQENSQAITWVGHPDSRFTFDLVADENVSQEKLFKVAGVPMVDNCMEGYNSCMFAYGQTGSGKTHTMLGDIEGGTRRHSTDCGMMPRVFEYLFSRIQKDKEARREEKLKFACKCSFLEIYNEQILDLLDPSSINLQLREDVKKGIYVENLKEVEVASARDVMQQLIQGAANRKVASTNMNRASSRSHSVFTCVIESKWESQGVTHHRFARLNLVDLAGSERQKSSGAEGERLKEATSINKSLSTLGLVIMNLVNISNGKSLHVPYRDSKLTFLLQDSLGGNAKTIIISNISPSSCCSLETLSTLKFAQRAKFIKNNAIINEDASGDVIAMRIQIQNLKREVSRLQVMTNRPAENYDNEVLAVSFPGSPGAFKWEGHNGSYSPLLMSGRRMSQKKGDDAALAGAFRRVRDKDIALQALVAENQATMQVAKQREDEIQGLKMRLRFREAGIKRLEAVAAGKISAEAHLLKEKEEYLKEIEVLRTQVNRSQEVTRFAMENMKLKEEIERLKSFYEEGERERANEQITVLQNKLLEALDWKLMNESDPKEKANSSVVIEELGEDDLLISNKEPRFSWQSSVNEESEFLRMQAIQNRAEIDSLAKKLELCLEEKENLERNVNDLASKLAEERSYRAGNEETTQPSDQTELKAMVDVIAAASQREAEAHETAIMLAKENDELRMKLKVLIDDNNKLIELYEIASAECNKQAVDERKISEGREKETEKEFEAHKTAIVLAKENDELRTKLKVLINDNNRLADEQKISEGREKEMEKEAEAHEAAILLAKENDELRMKLKALIDDKNRLVELYETASVECKQAVDDCKISEGREKEMEKEAVDLRQQLVEMHEENEKLMELYERAMQERDEFIRRLSSMDERAEKVAEVDRDSLERLVMDIGKLSRETNSMEDAIRAKQDLLESLKLHSSEIEERKALIQKKMSALKHSLWSFSTSVSYFEQREARASTRASTSASILAQKKKELADLQVKKDEIDSRLGKSKQLESELISSLSCLSLKLDEENKKHEDEKVLFAIENIEKTDSSQKNLSLRGRATELLKSEEEKTKLQAEIKHSQKRLGATRKELEDQKRRLSKVSALILTVDLESKKASKSAEETELALQNVLQEKNTLLEILESGKADIENMIVEYYQHVFDSKLKEAEMKELEGEIVVQRKAMAEAIDKSTALLSVVLSSG